MKGYSLKAQLQAVAEFICRNAFRAAVAGLAFIGSTVLLVSTRWGIGTYPDSLVYIGVARSILNGDGARFLSDAGEFASVTQYPPLYSTVIAVFGMIGVDPLVGSRWLGALLFAANAVLVAYLVYRITSSYGASLLAAFFALSSFPMVFIHSLALSEPLFIFLVFLGFSLLALYLQGSRPWMIYWASLCIGLSCLARYVGIAFILAGATAILCLTSGGWKKRLAHTTVFLFLSSMPLAAWVFRNLWFAGNAVNRTFGFHPPAVKDLLPATDTMGLWLFPTGIVDHFPWMSRSVLGIIFISLCWLTSKVNVSRSRHTQLLVFCLFGYGIFLLTSFSFNDQPLYFDTRTLALPYLAVMILAICLMTDWLRSTRAKGRSWGWFAFDCLIIVVSVVQMANGVVWLRYSYLNGLGLAAEQWRNSVLLKFVKNTEAPIFIASNAPDIIYTLTGNRAAMIARKVDPNTGLPNPRYAVETAGLQEQLKQTNGVIIYFNAKDRLWFLPSQGELEEKLPLQVVKTATDGVVYRIKNRVTEAEP